MRYVCDAPGGKTWFRIETEAEAVERIGCDAPCRRKVLSQGTGKGDADVSAAVQGQFRAGDRAEGTYPARNAAVPDIARRRGQPARHRDAAAGRTGRPHLPPDHRRTWPTATPMSSTPTRSARSASILAWRSNAPAATPTAATDRGPPCPRSGGRRASSVGAHDNALVLSRSIARARPRKNNRN